MNKRVFFGAMAGCLLVFFGITTPVVAQNGAEQEQDNIRFEQSRKEQLGERLYEATRGEERVYLIENDLAKIEISNKGAKVVGVELKGYERYGRDAPIKLFAEGYSEFDLMFYAIRNQRNAQINTKEFYFETDAPLTQTFVAGEEQKVISMRLYIEDSSYIEYVYTIKRDNYMVDFDVKFVNMREILSTQSDVLITWDATAYQNEKGFKNENRYTTIAYKHPNESGIDKLRESENTKSEDVNTRVQWVAFKQQYFSSIFVAKDNFMNGSFRFDTYIPTKDSELSAEDKIKKFNAVVAVPFSSTTTDYNFQFYFGPNHFKTLSQYKGLEFQKLIPLGGWLISWVNKYLVIPVVNYLDGFDMSYGLIILILTLLVKILILPLTYKSYMSGAKMRLIKPQMDALNDKFPNQEDAMKKQQETMALYKKYGISPMGGCVPMLIQFPFLIALFRFFPAAIELRGESFLWADDLSTYDNVFDLPFSIPFYGDHVSVFPLLMAVTMFFSSKITMSQQPGATNQQMKGMQNMMLYFMPVMMLFVLNNFSSGLTYYYFLSALIGILITFAFRYAIKDSKIMAKLEVVAAKPKKKSKFQQRLADMQKEQEKQQEELRRRAGRTKRKG